MKPGRFLPLATILLATSFLCGCPRPRQPVSEAPPPVEGMRTNASAPPAARAETEEWHRWRGPEGTGVSPAADWSPEFPPDGPRRLWKQEVGTGFSSISVANGRVYTMGNDGGQDTVYCFGLDSGEEIWKHSYPADLHSKYYEGGPSSTPAVDGSAVYTLSKNGDIFCLNAADGSVIWAKNLSQELEAKLPAWGFAGSVLIVGDRAFVNVGTYGTALNKNNGEVIWTTGKEASGYATPVPFDFEGEPHLAIFAAKSIAGVKQANGSVSWSHPWETSYDVNAADPIVNGNSVFISSGYGSGCALISFEGGETREVWRSEEMRNQANNCVLIDGHIYGIDGQVDDRQPQIKCLEYATGEVKWSAPILGTGALIAADGKLIILSGRGELITAPATPERFEPISRAQVMGGRCWTAPALSNGRILCRNSRGTLICLDVRKAP